MEYVRKGNLLKFFKALSDAGAESFSLEDLERFVSQEEIYNTDLIVKKMKDAAYEETIDDMNPYYMDPAMVIRLDSAIKIIKNE